VSFVVLRLDYSSSWFVNGTGTLYPVRICSAYFILGRSNIMWFDQQLVKL